MVSVSVLARVARAYGMEEKLLAHNPAELSNLATKPHILAGTFEAHIGMYFAQVMDGTMPFTVLKEYLSELFDSEMFADLRMRLEAAHKANLDQEQDVSSSKADTTAANPPNVNASGSGTEPSKSVEAHMGMLFKEVAHGNLPFTVMRDYFSEWLKSQASAT